MNARCKFFGLAGGWLAITLLSTGCSSLRSVKTTDRDRENELFEDVMVTGSHIVYRVPKDPSIKPVHIPPHVKNLDDIAVDYSSGERGSRGGGGFTPGTTDSGASGTSSGTTP